MAITGAILDFDGTLVDTLDAWRGIEGELAKLAHIEVTPEDRALLTTFTLDETSAWFHENFGLGESAADVRAMIDAYMVDYLSHEVAAMPGVQDFLEQCKREGVKMCVASSSPQLYLQTALEATGLSPYFSHVISVEDTPYTKRDPEFYDLVLDLLGTEKESTWGFDDSLYALQTMRGAGYPAVGLYDPHEREPFQHWTEAVDIAAHSFEELDTQSF